MIRYDLINILEQHAKVSTKDFKNIFCGKFMGQGVSRKTYLLKIDRNWVVKIKYRGDHENLIEHIIYQSADKAHQDLMAESLWINRSTTIQVQRRVIFKNRDQYPEYCTGLFGDFKCENYGWIGKRFVCVDYTYPKIFSTHTLTKVEWNKLPIFAQ